MDSPAKVPLSSTVWFDQCGDELIFLEVIGSWELDNAKPSRNGPLVQASHHVKEAAKYHAISEENGRHGLFGDVFRAQRRGFTRTVQSSGGVSRLQGSVQRFSRLLSRKLEHREPRQGRFDRRGYMRAKNSCLARQNEIKLVGICFLRREI